MIFFCLEPSTPIPYTPSVIAASEQAHGAKIELLHLIAAIAGIGVICSIIFILICFVFKRRNSSRDGKPRHFMLKKFITI